MNNIVFFFPAFCCTGKTMSTNCAKLAIRIYLMPALHWWSIEHKESSSENVHFSCGYENHLCFFFLLKLFNTKFLPLFTCISQNFSISADTTDDGTSCSNSPVFLLCCKMTFVIPGNWRRVWAACFAPQQTTPHICLQLGSMSSPVALTPVVCIPSIHTNTLIIHDCINKGVFSIR